MVYPICKRVVSPIYNLWLRKVEGLNNLPKANGFILAANHSSYYDTILLHVNLIPLLNKRIIALVNSYYWKNPITRIILNKGYCIPVYVKEGMKKSNKNSINKALSYLKYGEIILIFPEGSRSDDGKIKKGYSGVSLLALKSKCPVIPVGIKDSFKVLPKGKLFPRFQRCELYIGKPMTFPEYYKKKINNKILEQVTKKIMKNIANLIGQEYNY